MTKKTVSVRMVFFAAEGDAETMRIMLAAADVLLRGATAVATTVEALPEPKRPRRVRKVPR
jgi:hypothetical protein